MIVTNGQAAALNKWLKLHLVMTEQSFDLLTSPILTKARAYFENPSNGLTKLLTDFTFDQLSESPTILAGDIIPGSNPQLTWEQLSSRVELWQELSKWTSTPMPRTGKTPMEILSSVTIGDTNEVI